MIDFTNAIEEFNNYQGSEKKKKLSVRVKILQIMNIYYMNLKI